MNILIVEDEELAAEKLALMVATLDEDAEIIGYTSSIKTTVDWLRSRERPDVILMDIELSDGQSFEVFDQVDVESTVIFTTSYDEYALKAFKVNSIDYLLKPVQKDELKKAIEKYKKHHASIANSAAQIQHLIEQLAPKQFRKRFLVKQVHKQVPIEVEDIAYFFVHERTIFFKTWEGKKFIVDYKLDEIENMLNPAEFFRINRSFLVSIKSVLQAHDYFNSRLLLTLQPSIDTQIIVSRDKVLAFKTWIGK